MEKVDKLKFSQLRQEGFKMEDLINALERFDSLETVIAELRAYDNDREVTIEAVAEYLEDEADYANE